MNLVTFAQSDPNVFRVAAWQAAVVGTVFAAITGIIQLGLGIWRQRKEDNRKRAEIGMSFYACSLCFLRARRRAP